MSGDMCFTAFTTSTPNPGFFANYDTFKLKIKPKTTGDITTIDFQIAPTGKTYQLSSGLDLGDGWIQMSIPLSDYTGILASSKAFEFGIYNFKQTELYLTDIGVKQF